MQTLTDYTDLLFFEFTNESLSAIVKGLDINSSDRVLCVGGSGDQALALVEFAYEDLEQEL